MLAPAGVDHVKEAVIPIIKHRTDRIAEKIITFRKLLKILMEERAGNTKRLEIIMAPINLIPITIVRAVRIEIKAL